MQFGAVQFFFVLIALLAGLICIYSIYRTTRRGKAVEQVHTVLTSLAPTAPSEELLASMVEDANHEEDEKEPHIPMDDLPEVEIPDFPSESRKP